MEKVDRCLKSHGAETEPGKKTDLWLRQGLGHTWDVGPSALCHRSGSVGGDHTQENTPNRENWLFACLIQQTRLQPLRILLKEMSWPLQNPEPH